MSQSRTEQDKEAAGGPGKSSRMGHIDPEKGNQPGQKQTPHSRGPGGESGTKGVPEEKRRPGGS